MKSFYFCFLNLLILFFTWSANAQLVQVTHEVVMDHATYQALYPGDDYYPAGAVTYRIYAELQDPDDFVMSVFAINGCGESLVIGANDRIWNSAFGAVTGHDINSAFISVFPSTEFDSMITIGSLNSTTPSGNGSVSTIASLPAGYFGGASTFNTSQWASDFELYDGAWFVSLDSQNGFPTGPQNRVLLAQITTDQPEMLRYRLNLQVANEVIDGAPTDPQSTTYYVASPFESPACIPDVFSVVNGAGMGLIFGFDYGCNSPSALNYEPNLTNYLSELCVYSENNNSNCANAGSVMTGEVTQANLVTTNSDQVPGSCLSPNAQSNAWFEFTAPSDAVAFELLEMGLTNSGNDNIDIALWDACGGAEIACFEGVYPNSSVVFLDLVAGNTYYLQLSTEQSTQGAALFTLDSAQYGCTSPQACNFSPNADVNNGSCTFGNLTLEMVVFQDIDANGYWNNGMIPEPTMANTQITDLETGTIYFSDSNGNIEINVSPGQVLSLSYSDPNGVFQLTDGAEFYSFMVSQVPNCNSSYEMNFPIETIEETYLSVAGTGSSIWTDFHCTNGFYPGLYISNTGSLPFSGTITASFDPLLQADIDGVSSVDPVSFEPGMVTWEFVDQAPGSFVLYQFFLLGPGPEFLGEDFDITFDLTVVNGQGEMVYENTWILGTEVVCAYDPNDKLAEPEGYAEPHFILPNDEIEYRIRFQNTGNFPAEDVLIVDTLDIAHLDLSSFSPVYASHSLQTTLNANGVVEFLFNEIYLPDSTTNEPESHGFVVYRVRPRTDVMPGDVINNTAYIYFDENPPIITNTTWHTIYDCSELELLQGDLGSCEGESQLVSIDYPYVDLFEWSLNGEQTGDNAPALELEGLGPDAYTIGLTASNPLCSGTSQMALNIFPLPEAIITEEGAELTASNGVAWLWFLNDELIDGAISQSYVATENGNYSVLVFDENGCSAQSDQVFVLVIGVEENDEFGFVAYPNPSNGEITLQFKTASQGRVLNLYDLSGRILINEMPAFHSRLDLVLPGIANGTYILEVRDAEQTGTIRLMVQ